MTLRPSDVPASAHAFVDDIDRPCLGHDDLHHFARVLRLRPGERVTVAETVGSGPATTGRWRQSNVAAIGLLAADGLLEPVGPIVTVEQPARVTIAMALTKNERLELAMQKLSEIGVGRVCLFSADHSVVRWDPERAERHLARLRKIAREAAMQSRQVFVPAIEFRPRFEDVAAIGGVAIADIDGRPLRELSPAPCSMLIGPEGGFSRDERRVCDTRRIPVVRLPGGVLRAETAAIVAAAMLVERC